MLRPGVYIASTTRTWRHWRQPLPEHVRATKGRSRLNAQLTRQAIGAWLRNLAPTLLPPWFFLQGRSSARGSFTVAIAAVDGGVVLLAPRGNGAVVARLYGSGPLPPNYAAIRRRLGDHVALPDFDLRSGGWWLIEEFVEGQYLLELPSADQLQVVRKLFRSYATLVKHEAEGTCSAFFVSVLLTVRPASLPSQLMAAAAPVLHCEDAWPLVPSRPGTSAMNLVVAEGLRPVQIDLPAVTLAPFFYDPVSLIAGTRGPILAAFLEGALNEDLHALFSAAGLSFPSAHDRVSLLAATCVIRAHLHLTQPGSGSPPATGRAAERRWAEITAQLSG